MFCGQCGQGFQGEPEYMAHPCPTHDGATPDMHEYMGQQGDNISNAAIQRGLQENNTDANAIAEQEQYNVPTAIDTGTNT